MLLDANRKDNLVKKGENRKGRGAALWSMVSEHRKSKMSGKCCSILFLLMNICLNPGRNY